MTEIEKKIRWVYEDNENHYYRKNTTTNNWDEFENGKMIDSFKIQTYVSNKIILFINNEEQTRHVELSDNEARTVYGSIDALDQNSEKYVGYSVILTGDERKGEIFSLEQSFN